MKTWSPLAAAAEGMNSSISWFKLLWLDLELEQGPDSCCWAGLGKHVRVRVESKLEVGIVLAKGLAQLEWPCQEFGLQGWELRWRTRLRVDQGFWHNTVGMKGETYKHQTEIGLRSNWSQEGTAAKLRSQWEEWGAMVKSVGFSFPWKTCVYSSCQLLAVWIGSAYLNLSQLNWL